MTGLLLQDGDPVPKCDLSNFAYDLNKANTLERTLRNTSVSTLSVEAEVKHK